MADAGRVLLMPKGTYSASTNYEVLDWVRYSNGTYASKHNNNQGNTPTGNPTDPHWALLCQDGSGGGSNVSWTQLVTSGTKIATIEIDGVQTDVYAPSGGGSSVQSDWDESSPSDPAYIKNKPTIPAAQIQSDWNQTSTSALDFIKNKPTQLGHTMRPDPTSNPDEDDVVTWVKGASSTNDQVPSLYGVQNWSNAEITTLIAHIDSGDDTVGAWNDAWKTDGIRTGWIWHECLYDIVSDNEVEISIDFDVSGEEVVGLYAYRVDDSVTHGGVNGGAIAIKLTSPIQNASGVDVAINLKRQRTNLVTSPTILS